MRPVCSLHSGQMYTSIINLRPRDKKRQKKSLSWFHWNTARQIFLDKKHCQQNLYWYISTIFTTADKLI